MSPSCRSRVSQSLRAFGHLMIALDKTAMLEETDSAETKQLQLLAVIGFIMLVLVWLFGY